MCVRWSHPTPTNRDAVCTPDVNKSNVRQCGVSACHLAVSVHVQRTPTLFSLFTSIRWFIVKVFRVYELQLTTKLMFSSRRSLWLQDIKTLRCVSSFIPVTREPCYDDRLVHRRTCRWRTACAQNDTSNSSDGVGKHRELLPVSSSPLRLPVVDVQLWCVALRGFASLCHDVFMVTASVYRHPDPGCGEPFWMSQIWCSVVCVRVHVCVYPGFLVHIVWSWTTKFCTITCLGKVLIQVLGTQESQTSDDTVEPIGGLHWDRPTAHFQSRSPDGDTNFCAKVCSILDYALKRRHSLNV